MSTSLEPTGGPAAPVREDVMLEDMDRQLKEKEAADKKVADEADAKRKADIEAKARADAAAAAPADPRVKALEDALRISEDGRKRTEELLRGLQPKPDKPAEPAALTKDQLSELYAKDPIEAIAYMQTQALKTVEENITRRIEPLVSGGSASAMELARAKYPDEFTLFGSEIKAMLDDPRVSRTALGNMQAWDDLLAFIRGKTGNFEKLIEYRAGKDKDKQRRDAEAAQIAAAGTHTRSDVRPAAPVVGAELDEIERKIAEAIHSDLSPEEAHSEYKRFKGVGHAR